MAGGSTETDADTLVVFDGGDRAGKPLTTAEVAVRLGTAETEAEARLTDLEDEGVLASRRVGEAARIWWPSWNETRSSGDGATTDPTGTNETGILVVGVDHEVRRVNDRALEFFGLDRGAVEGTDARELVQRRLRSVVADHEAYAGAILDAYEDDAATTFEFRVLPGEGRRPRWLAHRSHPIRSGPYEGRRVEVFEDVTERKERERELEQRREQLAALDDLNAVLRSVTDAVVEQSTREEIEQVVCETLAATDAYEFAWFARVQPATGDVEPTAESGTGDYLDDVDLSSDPADPTGRGPTGRAIQTGEIRVVRDVSADEQYEPWRDVAERYRFDASAAVPITHEGTMYGVLNVYAGRGDVFEDAERDVLGQLGEVVGHAIAAVERKRALMGDEVVEVEFAVADVFADLDLETAPSGVVTFDRTVPVGDGAYLVFGSATAEGIVTLRAAAAALADWETVTVIEDHAEHHRFELRASEPPVLSAIASRGGRIEQARIEDGDLRLTVQLPPSVDVRSVVDVLQDSYPGTEMVTRRQVIRDAPDRERLEQVLEAELTERQRSVLETAYFAGFFEWPRDATGEDVAQTLEVSPPTFHQHVRTAERKLLASLFGEDTG